MRCVVVCHRMLYSAGVFWWRGKFGQEGDQAMTMLLYHSVPVSLLFSKNDNNNSIEQTNINNEIIGNCMA